MMHEMKSEMPPRAARLSGYLLIFFTAMISAGAPGVFAQTSSMGGGSTNGPGWIAQPLSIVDALNLTIQQNSTLKKARADLESSRGLVIQTRAIALPTVAATGNYTDTQTKDINTFPSFGGGAGTPTTNTFVEAHQNWDTQIRITQTIYQGGRTLSAFRAARLEKEQAMLEYQTAIQDALLSTRVAYYDVLLAEQQILVNEASVNLLTNEFEDQQRRFDAGTVPKFNVLQAEVALANARPPLISARNAYRVAKNNLSNQLGYDLPRDVWEDIPLHLTDKLESNPYSVELPTAIAEALQRRTELAALEKTEGLQRENIINARAGYQPTVNVFAAYDWHNNEFSEDVSDELNGWLVGAELNWNIFDGFLTRGKVIQAKAQLAHAKADVEDRARQIELEVRTDYSSFIEAREVLESQEKVQEEADEALRLARARTEAGTGTQLDVLNAETSLTQARTTQIQALHDYDVARARLERAIGQDMAPPKGEYSPVAPAR
jgi:TolC family type I secretion outer membrane protein